MTRTTTPYMANCKAKWCHFHIAVSTTRNFALATISEWINGSFIGLFLVTLLLLTSCGSKISSTTSSTHPTPTSTTGPIIPNPYLPHQGTLALNDPLRDNSLGYKWDIEKNQCWFAKDGYHVATAVENYSLFCVAYGTNFSNFAFETQMAILKGDSGGLFFRGDGANSKFYYFAIDQEGQYSFIVYTGHTSDSILAEGTIADFHKGAGKPNLIGVVAQGDQITLYSNHQQVKTIKNSTFSQGEIGVVAYNANSPVEVVFSDVKVWRL